MNTPVDKKKDIAEFLVLKDIIISGTKINRHTKQIIEDNIEVTLSRGQIIKKNENGYVPIPYTVLYESSAEKYLYSFVPKYVESNIDFIIKKTDKNNDDYNSYIVINNHLKHIYKSLSVKEESLKLHTEQDDKLLLYALNADILALKVKVEYYENCLKELILDLFSLEIKEDLLEVEDLEK